MYFGYLGRQPKGSVVAKHISIDGDHLYGKYKGTLLIVLGVDASNRLFPIPFVVVEGENKDSWTLFITCTVHYLHTYEGGRST